MNKTTAKIKSLLEIKQIDAYTENGCNICPPEGETLYRIDYWQAVNQAHPNAHGFGSMSCFDGHDAARELAKETFGSYTERLGIPVFVFSVETNE